jgi:hypothetical protein
MRTHIVIPLENAQKAIKNHDLVDVLQSLQETKLILDFTINTFNKRLVVVINPKHRADLMLLFNEITGEEPSPPKRNKK